MKLGQLELQVVRHLDWQLVQPMLEEDPIGSGLTAAIDLED